jgi:LL-diaminopimelate aminotransferase
MAFSPSPPLARLGGYAFDELDSLVARLEAEGVRVIDFGVGDPRTPTPAAIRRAAQEGLDTYATAGYPSYVGNPALLREVTRWNQERFGVSLDPAREITVTLGSKEAVFHFPMAVLQPGEIVLVPTPGYPPYRTGTAFAGGEVYNYPLSPENGFLPDLEAIPAEVVARARILWLNYPNSPTGAVAPDAFFEAAVEFCRRNGIILASDEAYTEIYFGGKPPRSVLEFGREGVVVFQSLSKRSAMTGYRVGWACGDEQIIRLIRKLKTNIDSGSPNFVQAAAIAALRDESHVQQARDEYGRKQRILLDAFARLGLDASPSAATIYLWQRAPKGLSDVEYAKALLAPEVACAVMPGSWLAQPAADGTNPGEGYVRWALCPLEEEVAEAAERLSRLSL